MRLGFQSPSKNLLACKTDMTPFELEAEHPGVAWLSPAGVILQGQKFQQQHNKLITILSSNLKQASHQSKGVRAQALVLKLSEKGVPLCRTQ